MKDRHDHSVLEVCQRLHEDITSDPLEDDERIALIDWLTRRLKAWRNTPADFHSSTVDYDHAVKLLARAALDMHAADRREHGL